MEMKDYARMNPVQILNMMDAEKERMILAEIQKKLTKAAPFFSARLTEKIGLRYAPEIRFYKDNSLQIYDQYKQEVFKYVNEMQQENEKDKEVGIPSEIVMMKQKLQSFKKLDPIQKNMLLMQADSEEERNMLKIFMNKEKVEELEKQLEEFYNPTN